MESMVLQRRRLAVTERLPLVAEASVKLGRNPRPPAPYDDPVELERFGAVAWHERSRYVIVRSRHRRRR